MHRRVRGWAMGLLLLAVLGSAAAGAAAEWLSPNVCALSTLVHLYRGAAQAKAGDFEAASASLRLALSLRPEHSHPDDDAALGWACMRLEWSSSERG